MNHPPLKRLFDTLEKPLPEGNDEVLGARRELTKIVAEDDNWNLKRISFEGGALDFLADELAGENPFCREFAAAITLRTAIKEKMLDKLVAQVAATLVDERTNHPFDSTRDNIRLFCINSLIANSSHEIIRPDTERAVAPSLRDPIPNIRTSASYLLGVTALHRPLVEESLELVKARLIDGDNDLQRNLAVVAIADQQQRTRQDEQLVQRSRQILGIEKGSGFDKLVPPPGVPPWQPNTRKRISI